MKKFIGELIVLFRKSPLQGVLTLTGLVLCVYLIVPVFSWAIFDADFIGESRDDCISGGACWVFISQRMMQFIIGFYPNEMAWRPFLVIALLVLTLIPVLWLRCPRRGLLITLSVLIMPLLSWAILDGRMIGLEYVETDKWGGLLLTLLISTVGIFVSLPLGILLALSRQSNLPILKTISIGFIEFWRGVPLITVLFMASVMLPLFFPPGFEVNKLLRVLIGVSLFSAAYMAEVVRGGLTAIPRGQYEAATALGLSYFKTMRMIILPQALRHVIPGIVNTFIGLFKDTSLVLVVSMFDLLGMVQAASTDPNWLGFAMEGYIFAGLVFWVFCYSMSRYSLKLEQKLSY